MSLLENLGILQRSAQPADVSTELRVQAGIADKDALIPQRAAAGGDVRALDAVYRALSILESTARQLTVDVWRGRDRLDPKPSIAVRPSLDLLSFGQFTAETVSSMAQAGNAYWHVTRAANGYDVINLDVIEPARVTVDIDGRTHRRRLWLDGREADPRDLVHLRLTHTPGEPYGQSPLKACVASLEGALELRRYADEWTRTSGAPSGILTTDQDLTTEQADKYKERANRSLQYGQGVAVLGKGLTYSRIMLNPKELQFLESQNANVTMIARMFGIPARMMLASIEGSAQTYANLEAENAQFIKTTLMAYLGEIEDALTAVLPRGQRARFNLDAYIRYDTAARYAAHKTAIEAGFLDIDEVRDIEGLPVRTRESEPAA